MRKKLKITVMLIILSIVVCSCYHRYYSEYPGKVTKGYHKPPKEIKKSEPKYPKRKKRLE